MILQNAVLLMLLLCRSLCHWNAVKQLFNIATQRLLVSLVRSEKTNEAVKTM